MGISVFPAPVSASVTRKVLTLTSGVSWTVPAGVTFVNVTLRGGGGGGAGGISAADHIPVNGQGGQIVSSTLTTTPGASISYAIGAGGTGGIVNGGDGGNGGTTTFTGATSAVGGLGAGGGNNNYTAKAGTAYLSANNGATSQGNGSIVGAVGGVGSIDVEYWV
jgi:hypothetical protein